MVKYLILNVIEEMHLAVRKCKIFSRSYAENLQDHAENNDRFIFSKSNHINQHYKKLIINVKKKY